MKNHDKICETKSKNFNLLNRLENKINYLEKNKIDRNSIKYFIKNNKSILKIKPRFKSERRSIFTEVINKIALISNGDKRMQSIDSIETYATRKWNMWNKKRLGSDKKN